jgi:sterol desaturase/sphingolipid hydroxylase (fatty acid hydroxylase superfamily)
LSAPTDRPTLPGWEHVPDVPIKVSPFFSWPPKPAEMWQWLSARWLRLAENVIVLGICLAVWIFTQPALEQMETLSLGWIAQIWLRNLVLMFVVAGSLHWFFFMRKGQGKRLKFDPRDLATKGKQFNFGVQVKDNMLWSLTSGVGFWAAYEVLMFKERKALALGTFHHQMHHRYFEVNYGNLEMPWDKWFGAFHNGTPEAHVAMKDRRQLREKS